jgi:hypothetical protein
VKLTRAVEIVADFAPSLREGLQAMQTVGRTVSAIIPIPPVRPLAWCAWKLRGLTGVAMIGHVVLVTAGERPRAGPDARMAAWFGAARRGSGGRVGSRRGAPVRPRRRWRRSGDHVSPSGRLARRLSPPRAHGVICRGEPQPVGPTTVGFSRHKCRLRRFC